MIFAWLPPQAAAFTPSPPRQVGPLFEQFPHHRGQAKVSTQNRARSRDEALQKCILIGFSDRVARRLDQGTLRCELVHNRRGVLARESSVQKAPLLVVAEIREIETRDKEMNTILSLATAIEKWTGCGANCFPKTSNSICTSSLIRQVSAIQSAGIIKISRTRIVRQAR